MGFIHLVRTCQVMPDKNYGAELEKALEAGGEDIRAKIYASAFFQPVCHYHMVL